MKRRVTGFHTTNEKHRVAKAIKAASLKAAIEAYHHVKMSGLCQEGACQLAVDAIKSLDVITVLRHMPS